MTTPGPAVAVSARHNVLGAVHMVIGLFLFGVMEVLIKWQVADYPVHQLVFFRASFGLIPCLVLVWQAGGISSLKTTRPLEHLLRSAVGLSAMWLVFSAYETMNLADVGAILFAAPLFLTALAGPVLGEAVGARRWTAVMIGFVGVLLIVKPGTTALQPAALGVLAAAFLFAVAMTLMRRLGSTESAATITFYLSVFIVLVSLVLIAMFGWVTPTSADFLALAMIGLIGGTAQLFLTQSLRLGEAAVISPLRYSSIIWSVLFGYIFWGALPDMMVVGGLAIVISSGLYILHRETRLAIVERRRDLPLTPQWPARMLPSGFLMLAMVGIIGGIAQLFMTKAFRLGEAGVISPLKYSSMIWVVLFGYVIWGDLPSLHVVIGVAIVIASGLYIVHREAVLAIARRRLVPIR